MTERLVLRDPADPRRPGARPDHRRPRAADLPDDVLRLRRRRARGEPVRAGGVRQHLHAHHEPDAGRRRGPLAALEGGVGALLLATRAGRRDDRDAQPRRGRRPHRLQPALYGGTYNLFHYTLPKLGIEVDLRRGPRRPRRWRAAIRPNTKALLRRDASATRRCDILDIEGVAGVAHEAGVPLIVDNTSRRRTCSARSSRGPTSSCTRRRSSSAATAPRSAASSSTPARSTSPPTRTLPEFNQPDPTTTAWSTPATWRRRPLGGTSFILKARVQLLRDLGPRPRRSTRS